MCANVATGERANLRCTAHTTLPTASSLYAAQAVSHGTELPWIWGVGKRTGGSESE
jgi:hypothetical protein